MEELEAIVQRMIDAGQSSDKIREAVKLYKEQNPPTDVKSEEGKENGDAKTGAVVKPVTPAPVKGTDQSNSNNQKVEKSTGSGSENGSLESQEVNRHGWLNYESVDTTGGGAVSSGIPLFNQDEDDAVAQLTERYRGFEFETSNIGPSINTEGPGFTVENALGSYNVVKATKKKANGDIVSKKFKVGYGLDESHEESYNALTSFIDENSNSDTDKALIKAEQENTQAFLDHQERVKFTEEEEYTLKEKFLEDEDLFKPVEEEVVTRLGGGMDGKFAPTLPTTTKVTQPYEEELNTAIKVLKKLGVENPTKQEIESKARDILLSNSLTEIVRNNTVNVLEELESSSETEEPAYSKFLLSNLLDLKTNNIPRQKLALGARQFQLQYNAKVTELGVVNLEINEGKELAELKSLNSKLSNKDYNFKAVEGEELVKLSSGKVVPARAVDQYNNTLKSYTSKVERGKTLYEDLVGDSYNIESIESQMDLLKRSYNSWEEFTIETGVGLAEMGAQVVYGTTKAFFPIQAPIVDDKMINVSDWANGIRGSYAKDVEFGNAFSSIKNFGSFAAQELSNQIPIFAALAAPGGQALLFTSSFGSRYSDMVREDRSLTGEKTSETEKWFQSLGFGATEMVFESLTTLPLIRNAKKTFINSPKGNGLFNDGFKTYFKENAAKSLVYEPLGEAVSEGATTISQNLISGTSLFEGLDHSMFSGLMFGTTLSSIPFTKGLYLSKFSDFETKQNARNKLSEMTELDNLNTSIRRDLDELGESDLGTEQDLADNEERMLELREEYVAEMNKVESKYKTLSPRAAEDLLGAETRMEVLRLDAARVRESSMPDDIKDSKLARIKMEFDQTNAAVEQFKASDTFTNNWTLFQANRKNKSETKRINSLAKLKLSQEGNSNPDEATLSEEARVIYNKEYIRSDLKKSNGENKVVAHETVEETVTYLENDTEAKIANLSKQNLSESKLASETQKLKDDLQEAVYQIKNGANGFMDTNSKGEKISLVNIDNAAKNDRLETRTHEVKHAIFVNALSNDPKAFKGLSDQVLDWTKKNKPDAYKRIVSRVERRADDSMLEDEVIAVFFEEVANNRINLETEGNSIFSGLLGFLASEGSKNSTDADLNLAGETDAVKFLIGAAKKIKAGTLTLKEVKESAIIKEANKVVDTDSVDAGKFSKDKLSPLEQINKLIPEGFDKPFKDLTRREQMNIIDPIFIETLDNGVISNYVKSRSTSPEEYNKAIEGVRDRLVNFNPKAKRKTGSKMPITFGEFVFANTRFGKLDAKKELYEESELRSRQGSIDAPEAAQVSDSDSNVEDFDSINLTEDHVQETSKFRRELNLGQDMVDKMIDTIVKTFGTNLPNIQTKQFKQALAKAFKTELKITMQNFMGKSKDYDAFLEEYMPIVFNRLPLDVLVAMERLVHSDKMLAKYPNAKKIFTTSYRETSAIKVDELIAQDRLPKDTNRTSGPQVHTKLEYPGIKKIMAFYRGNSKIIDKETGEEVKISMLGELGYEVGASSFGPRKDVLAERIITEVTFDGVAETIQKESVRGKIEGLNIAGIDNLENDLAIIAKQISRNPSVKFSKKGNIAKDFYISIIDGGMTENSIIVAANKHYPDSNKSALNKIVKQTLKKVGIVVERNEVLQGKLKEISGKTKVEALLEIDVQDNFKKGIKNALRGLLEAEGNGKAIDPGTLANTVKGLNAQRNHLVDVVSSMVETEGLVKGVEVIISHTQAMYAGAGKAGDGGLMPHKPGGQIIPTPNWNGDNGLKWKVYTQADVNAGIVPKGKKIGDFKLDSKGRKISRDNRQQATNGVEDFVALINQGLPKGTVLTNPSKGKFVLTDTKTGVETTLNTSLHGESSASLFSDIKRKGVKQTFKDRKQTSLDARKVTKVVLDLAWSKINKGDMTAGDFGLLVMSIGSSMNSPLRRSAYADRIPSNYKQLIAKYGPKAVGKLFQYEHGTPKEAVATKIIQSYLDTGKMSDKVWDNYTVQVIHKALDRIIDASGHKYTERIDGQPRAFNAQTMALAVDLSDKDFNELAPLESLDPSDTEVMGKNWLEVVDLLRNKVELSPNVLSRVGKGARTKKWSKNAVTKGMSTFDFDETLIIDGENFVVATKDGETIKIRSEEWPTKGPDLASQDYSFDFSDFAKVRGGKEGPLLQKMKNQVKKYGAENVFVLTARQQDAAGPIHEWLRSQGINVPLENITGLGKSEGSAKGEWMLQKFAEGYNDMYFVDDAMSNVKAVKDVLDALDIKSKVVQAKIKFSKNASVDFNKMLEKSKGIRADVEVSSAAAKIRGAKKGRFDFFVPPSAEDFKGLMYSFLGKGKQGEADLLWFKDNLFDPFAKGIREMDSTKQTMTEEYKTIKKSFPTTIKGLNKNIAGTDFTLDNAIRVYLWKEAGFEIPGLSEKEVNTLWSAVNADATNTAFAKALSAISRSVDGYTKPSEFWVAETIASDLSNIVNRVNRAQYLSEWIESKDLVFSKENLNKIESIYGTNFREALENILFRMESGSNRPSGQDKDVNNFTNWINGSVGAVMFFNTRSAVLQTLSIVNFINFKENNIFAAAKGFANQKQFWTDFAMIYNSDMLKQRRAGLKIDVSASELTDAFSKGKSRPEAVIAYLLQIGFTPTQIADSFAISMGGSTYYRNMLNKYMKDGMSKADAEAKAFLDFQEIAEETQQSSRPDMISQQQSGTLGRIILAWANTPMQMTRLTKKALSDLVNGRGDVKSNVSKILYYGVIQNFIFGSLQTGLAFLAFGDEEDEEKTQTKEMRVANGMLDTLLRGTGIYGAAVSTIKNVILKWHEENPKGYGKRDWSKVAVEITSLSPPISTKVRKVMNAVKTYSYNEDVIEKMGPGINNPGWSVFANVVEATTNAPVARLLNKANNVKTALTNDMETWKRVTILMGWSAWSVGVEDQELVDAKAEVKADRKANRKAASKKKSEQKKVDNEKAKANIKTVRCSGTKSDGSRCSIQVETKAKTAKCTYHKTYKPSESSDRNNNGIKEYQCRAVTGSGKRCNNRTENYSRKCYAHK